MATLEQARWLKRELSNRLDSDPNWVSIGITGSETTGYGVQVRVLLGTARDLPNQMCGVPVRMLFSCPCTPQ